MLWTCHCTNYNYLISFWYNIQKFRICTVPLVDSIDGDTYVFTPQAGGDENNHARGAWDWDLLWKRIPLTKREKVRLKNKLFWTVPTIKQSFFFFINLTKFRFFRFLHFENCKKRKIKFLYKLIRFAKNFNKI